MSEAITIRGTKEESQSIRWVQKAASKDHGRPVLNGIHVVNGNIHATDGFRVHVTVAPTGFLVVNDVILQGKIPSGDFIADLDEIVGKYPDLSTFAKEEPPVFTICVNAKYLAEAASGMNGSVRLAFWGDKQPMELLGESKDAVPCHVTMMPMDMDAVSSKAWRPFGGPLKD